MVINKFSSKIQKERCNKMKYQIMYQMVTNTILNRSQSTTCSRKGRLLRFMCYRYYTDSNKQKSGDNDI